MKKYSIRQRGLHLYELRYTYNGKQKSLYGRTKQICKQKYMQSKKQTPQAKARGLVVNNWFSKWLDLYKSPLVSKGTCDKIASIYSKYIKEEIGNKLLKSVKTEHIQKLINKMSSHPRQQTICLGYLNNMFKQAFLTNLIDYNPCTAVVIKKDYGKQGRALTSEELKKLHNYLDNNYCDIKNLILIYLNTGMRRNELLQLRYEDLDFERNEIHIKGTKTSNSDRILQTTRQVLDLFPKKDKPFANWSISQVSHRFTNICKLLNFKGISLHSLRHTFATQCIQKGVDMVVLQKWLGHASITMTMDRYTHIEEEYKRTQTIKMQDLI